MEESTNYQKTQSFDRGKSQNRVPVLKDHYNKKMTRLHKNTIDNSSPNLMENTVWEESQTFDNDSFENGKIESWKPVKVSAEEINKNL